MTIERMVLVISCSSILKVPIFDGGKQDHLLISGCGVPAP